MRMNWALNKNNIEINHGDGENPEKKLVPQATAKQ